MEITIHSDMPAGAATGTSAAVTVALVAALEHLAAGAVDPAAVARAAHAVEAEGLGRESGIQDQIGAAHGGVNFIEMRAYPDAIVSPVPLAAETWWALDQRLLLVYLGGSHDSSDVHRRVIAALESDAGAPGPRSAARRRRGGARCGGGRGSRGARARHVREHGRAGGAPSGSRERWRRAR